MSVVFSVGYKNPVPLPITDCPEATGHRTGGDAAGIKRQFPDTSIYVASPGNKIQIDFLADAVGTWFSVIHQKFGRSGAKSIGAKPFLKWPDNRAVRMAQAYFNFIRVRFPELEIQTGFIITDRKWNGDGGTICEK